jgi:hypothetical protein
MATKPQPKKVAAKTDKEKDEEREAAAKQTASNAGFLRESKDITPPRSGPVDEGSIMAPGLSAPTPAPEGTKVEDSDGNELAVNDKVFFSGKVTALNEPFGVTVRVGTEKGDFVDISLPAKLISQEE